MFAGHTRSLSRSPLSHIVSHVRFENTAAGFVVAGRSSSVHFIARSLQSQWVNAGDIHLSGRAKAPPHNIELAFGPIVSSRATLKV